MIYIAIQIQSTKLYIFDTDLLSTFLYTNCENVLTRIFKQIIIPKKVYNELCQYTDRNGNTVFKEKIDILKKQQKVKIVELELGSEEWQLYFEMTTPSQMKGIKIIGQGEAACIAFAKANNAIICSNNLKDILFYVNKYNLEYLTTAKILYYSYENDIINWLEIEKLWNIIKKRSKLPFDSFGEYFNNRTDNEK